MSRRNRIRLQDALANNAGAKLEVYQEKDFNQRYAPDWKGIISALGAYVVSFVYSVQYVDNTEPDETMRNCEMLFYFAGMCKFSPYDHATYIDIWMFDDGAVHDIIPYKLFNMRKIADKKLSYDEQKEFIKTKLASFIMELDKLDEKDSIIQQS